MLISVLRSRRHVHGTGRNHGADGVLVDHLRDCVAKKDDILVKRFNLTLKLDAVDELTGTGAVFRAKDVEERILQKLTFRSHIIFLRPCSTVRLSAGLMYVVVIPCRPLTPGFGRP